MRIIGFGGVPASGKTTLFKTVIKEFNFTKRFKWKTIFGQVDVGSKLIVLGAYDEGLFSGTDRLSMAAQPDFIKWVNATHRNLKGWTVLFEGDRLFSQKVIEASKTLRIECKFIILTLPQEERERRSKGRGDTQSEKFVKGRLSKVNNILQRQASDVERWDNSTQKMGLKNAKRLLFLLKGY